MLFPLTLERRCCLLCNGWVGCPSLLLCELSVALVKGNEVVNRKALHVYATAGGTSARAGATCTVPTVDPDHA
jgi:hypothetical protein